MKANIRTEITDEMKEALPDGYVIYGNGSEQFAALVKKAGNPDISIWLGGMLNSWCRPRKLVGDNGDYIYAVPIRSKLHLLLSEKEKDKPATTLSNSAFENTVESLRIAHEEEMKKISECRVKVKRIEAAIDALEKIESLDIGVY